MGLQRAPNPSKGRPPHRKTLVSVLSPATLTLEIQELSSELGGWGGCGRRPLPLHTDTARPGSGEMLHQVYSPMILGHTCSVFKIQINCSCGQK